MGGDGVFITVDGPSGVGKSTVARFLERFLAGRGRAVTCTAEPSSAAIGQLARFGTHEFHGRALSCLIAADRYHHIDTVVTPALDRGEVVVCDRYLPSSLVLDQLDGVPVGFVWATHRDLPWPNLAVFLAGAWQLCAERAAERGNHSRFHRGDEPAKRREAELFQHVAGQLAAKGYPVARYDIGTQDIEAVQRGVAHLVCTQLGV
ncbi:dTMP kinase [Streptomyces sp. SL13]|uniref:Thymidylate kinase n=1 Tax=Streptantibioticus silvisoli TaxID=2705255 RepID=A0AA90JWS5_9ACTN|nr:dTMP kinase [Streptantibioticus silvisoli]MDI5969371.1 dTMP kinase [Streptantibioticus silvisoli]